MKLGMVGLGRMGGNMAKRLETDGHVVQSYARSGGGTAGSLEELVGQLDERRAVWLMIPAGDPTEQAVQELLGLLDEGDVIVELGGQKVETWPQLLRKLRDLRGQQPQGEFATALDLPSEMTHVHAHGAELVLLRLRRVDGTEYPVWCRLGNVPIDTVAPSLFWVLLKIGLFVVGAYVFWKRPEDRSAALFFLLCVGVVLLGRGGVVLIQSPRGLV